VDLFTCNIFLFFFHALRLPRDLHSFPTRRSSDLTRGDGRESLNLPFPFYSKGRERKGDGLAGWKTGKKERRQRTPADAAFIFRGASAQKPNRLNEAANKRIPRQRERFRRGWWTAGKEPYADPRLSPRGLPNPAGRFRRGATCGKWRTLAGDTRSVTIFVPEAG